MGGPHSNSTTQPSATTFRNPTAATTLHTPTPRLETQLTPAAPFPELSLRVSRLLRCSTHALKAIDEIAYLSTTMMPSRNKTWYLRTKVAELRALCKASGIPTAGLLKPDLVEALVARNQQAAAIAPAAPTLPSAADSSTAGPSANIQPPAAAGTKRRRKPSPDTLPEPRAKRVHLAAKPGRNRLPAIPPTLQDGVNSIDNLDGGDRTADQNIGISRVNLGGNAVETVRTATETGLAGPPHASPPPPNANRRQSPRKRRGVGPPAEEAPAKEKVLGWFKVTNGRLVAMPKGPSEAQPTPHTPTTAALPTTALPKTALPTTVLPTTALPTAPIRPPGSSTIPRISAEVSTTTEGPIVNRPRADKVVVDEDPGWTKRRPKCGTVFGYKIPDDIPDNMLNSVERLYRAKERAEKNPPKPPTEEEKAAKGAQRAALREQKEKVRQAYRQYHAIMEAKKIRGQQGDGGGSGRN